MIHPSTELHYINETVGNGVFARKHIPAGTIVYVQDALEIAIEAQSPLLRDTRYRPILETFCTVEPDGSRLLSWDIAKHVNHACRSNTLSSSYGFEIAVRSIKAGEEITDDYGMFNLNWELTCDCGDENCRQIVRSADFDRLVPYWDGEIRRAFLKLFELPQPLLSFLDRENLEALQDYLAQKTPYRSVATLKYTGSDPT